MYSKIIPSALVIFSLLVISESKVKQPSNLDQYYDCFNHAECEVDMSDSDSIFTCFDKLSDKQLQPIFKYVNDTYVEYHTDSVPEAVQEYCNLSGDFQKQVYKATVKGIFSYQDMKCDQSMEDECDNAETLLKCFLNLFKNLQKMDYC
ncbi:uncharacterized protein LOC129970223 [Argiope bruennichi]|uniref:Uncharacterized protein n=1 Tax=Argiope bruennichi TaxID=94029 RepID=A0A8T0E2A6_ARGBR|nr:uncharacterized protein LOC129970223 [Argiope bruennichi]KAF8763424.1 hypothetical protein HNY73_021611 [Argiope bruennichi]